MRRSIDGEGMRLHCQMWQGRWLTHPQRQA